VIDVKPAGDDIGGNDEVPRPHFRLAERYENEPFVLHVGGLLVFQGQPEELRRCRLDLKRDDATRFGVLSQHVGSLDTSRSDAGSPATPG
jgi:hypothetical protein